MQSILTSGDCSLAFVHRRLSILDLTDNGRQPMFDPATRNWITFNGEIYNYKSIRARLEAHGDTFRSQSDTEVVLRAYARWGLGALDLMQGMFAFALWDAAKENVILAVDPLGIKPLYWHRSPDGSFAFASEMRALLDAGIVPRKASASGLGSFLAYGAVQGPGTAIEGIQALQAGCVMTVTNTGQVDGPKQYWRPQFRPNRSPHPGRGETVEALTAVLDEVAREHLVSDVPVSIFLSGGVDSSALAALVRPHSPRLTSFSVCFDESEWSEARFAGEVARALDLDHSEIRLTAADLLSCLPRALSALDQPTLDGTNVFVISEAVRSRGFKVALSGQGGDEVFGGYSTFKLVPRALRWQALVSRVPSFARHAGASMVRLAQRRALPGKIGQFLEQGGGPLPTYLLLRQLFAPASTNLLFPHSPNPHSGLSEEFYSELTEAAAGLDPIDAVSLFELRCYLGQMLLRDGDVMSMAHGLEVRVPFLDRRVVGFLANLPGPMKMEPNRPKPLLLDAVAGKLPPAIWSRPKQGFTFPWEEWLRGPIKPLGDEAINDRATWLSLGFSPDEVGRLWVAFQDRRRGLSWSRIWALIALREWALRNKVAL